MNIFIKIVAVFISLSFYSCNSQNINDQKNKTTMKLIDSSFEKIDINNLGEAYKANELGHMYVEKADTLKDGTIIAYNGRVGYYYYQEIKPKKGWFKIQKEFYPNGNIKTKMIFNKTSEDNDIGKEYLFDKDGKLVKTTDYDQNYKMSFEQITEIAEKYRKKYNYHVDANIDGVISEDQSWNKQYVKIWRKEKNNKRYWYIGFNKFHYGNPDDKKCERLVILIDDSTEKIIEIKHYFDWYNKNFKEMDEK